MSINQIHSEENDKGTVIPAIANGNQAHHKTIEPLGTDYSYKRKTVWSNVIFFLLLHLGSIYGTYLVFTKAKAVTFAWCLFVGLCSGQGITMGAHRLWTHRTYKANLPLRIILMVLQTIAGQNCIYVWSRDHRLHHKYSDTDADPHNANLGFFFSHIGWLLHKKHPLVKEKGKTLELRDLENDPIVSFQRKYYFYLYAILAVYFPIFVPTYFWNETFRNSLFICFALRYVLSLNGTWLVNSWAHIYGYKPYDVNIKPKEAAFVSFITSGEGWHNYHHTFPWDYKTSELAASFNFTRILIEFAEKIGWAYDLKTASESLIESKVLRSGNGSQRIFGKKPTESGSNDMSSSCGSKQNGGIHKKSNGIINNNTQLNNNVSPKTAKSL